ncbi:unnamed protein product [Pleuronectes platessa]|uniref:Uncharacterized protein n=1 Tax=Pleuronectes platessa TaxID=8262 RepID=A0A9N7YYG8_PLEPL|nr:unnamed protein product [Pleuronectes platessa]
MKQQILRLPLTTRCLSVTSDPEQQQLHWTFVFMEKTSDLFGSGTKRDSGQSGTKSVKYPPEASLCERLSGGIIDLPVQQPDTHLKPLITDWDQQGSSFILWRTCWHRTRFLFPPPENSPLHFLSATLPRQDGGSPPGTLQLSLSYPDGINGFWPHRELSPDKVPKTRRCQAPEQKSCSPLLSCLVSKFSLKLVTFQAGGKIQSG